MDAETTLKRPSRIIGLTGGVGMGKTTVSSYLYQTYGLPILDADLYARQVVEPGTAALSQIAARYGARVLQADGSLNRRQLGDILFGNAVERQWIEQVIHPAVQQQIETELEGIQNQDIAVVVIPLLFEAKMTDLVTEIWVVHTTVEQQRERLQQRDQLSPEQVQARIKSQMAIEQKIAQADIVLDNSTSLQQLFEQIDQAIGAI